VSDYRAPWALLPEGWKRDVRIAVAADGAIAAVEPDSPQGVATRLAGPVVAGMPNAHSHVLQRALAGRSEGAGRAGDSFWSWRETMYAFTRAVEPDEFEAIATGAYVEMLKAGYTSVAEFHYLHNAADGNAYARPGEMSERVIAAAQAAGIALTLLPVLYRYGDFGAVPAAASQARFLMSVEAFAALWDSLAAAMRGSNGVKLGVAAHSLRAVKCEEIAALLAHVDACAGPQVTPMHLHISEQRREVEACVAAHGVPPLELLGREFELGPRWSLVHATHATPGELTLVARAKAVVVACPTTEANLGDGIFPAAAFSSEGGRIAIGSDSHVSLDVAEELRWLEYSQRLALQRRHVLRSERTPAQALGEALYGEALSAGAQSLEQPVGSIAAGRRADFLVLDESPDEVPSLDRAIFRSGAWRVRDVFVAGRAVVREGRHADDEAIASRSAGAVRAVLRRT
jgi:formimidoylglutamate deiminase